MTISFEISDVFMVEPAVLYRAWLNSEEHTAMIGYRTEISNDAVTPFSAGEGYIHGMNLELEPGKRILQRWRTTDFADDDEDSLLEILFEIEGVGTRMTIKHSKLPADGMQYKQGWEEWYIQPMQAYFSR